MTEMYLEITNDTLISTDRGVVKLTDLLRRHVETSLWAIAWRYEHHHTGISFHPSHAEAKKFAEGQLRYTPHGPARLVKVSSWLENQVLTHGFCWADIPTFESAETYEGPEWKH
jgi:hypothetical protein